MYPVYNELKEQKKLYLKCVVKFLHLFDWIKCTLHLPPTGGNMGLKVGLKWAFKSPNWCFIASSGLQLPIIPSANIWNKAKLWSFIGFNEPCLVKCVVDI